MTTISLTGVLAFAKAATAQAVPFADPAEKPAAGLQPPARVVPAYGAKGVYWRVVPAP